jgi:hypothetical protein
LEFEEELQKSEQKLDEGKEMQESRVVILQVQQQKKWSQSRQEEQGKKKK